jgi:hypothetical protein
VLDVVDNSSRHNLVTATTLLGAEATDAGGRDLREVLQEEGEERRKKEEEDIRARRVAVDIRSVPVDPFLEKYPGLKGYRPRHPDENGPARDWQKVTLRRRKVPFPEDLTEGQADWLLDQPTGRQRGFLKSRGYWREGMRFLEAQDLIGSIMRREARLASKTTG